MHDPGCAGQLLLQHKLRRVNGILGSENSLTGKRAVAQKVNAAGDREKLMDLTKNFPVILRSILTEDNAVRRCQKSGVCIPGSVMKIQMIHSRLTAIQTQGQCQLVMIP